MSRTQYAPKQKYTGDGSLNVYTFDFKIEDLKQLLVIEMDDTAPVPVELNRVRGDDTGFLSGVVFNSVTGGGTVTLQANLANNHELILLLANDEPTQPFIFSNKLAFSLKRIEAALDFLGGAVQRLAYRGKQAIRIHDSEDEETFDAQLPPGIADNAGNVIGINATGDGLEFVENTDPTISTPINVTENQGSYSPGDVIPAGTVIQDIIRNMLTSVVPPTLTLAGTGATLVESGTMINPTLTPTFTQNDAGAASNYELTKDALPIFNNAVPAPFGDGPFAIVDQTITYNATCDYAAGLVSPGSLTSNNVTYRGARAAFWDVDGDPVNIRSNSQSLVGVQGGSQLVSVGDDVALDIVFAYPDSLGDPTSLFLSNTGGNFDITPDLVRETNQSVNDASGGNAITYRVYSYTALIPLKSSDTLTLTI